MVFDLSAVLSDRGRTMDIQAPITLKQFTCRAGSYPVAKESAVSLKAVSAKQNVLVLDGSRRFGDELRPMSGTGDAGSDD